MTKMICSNCGRYYEKEGKDMESHGICARCNLFLYPDLYETRDDKKEVVRFELDDGTIWKGEDKSNFTAEQEAEFNSLLAEVRAERGEGGVDKR